jgi:hypothetical protein
MAVSGSLSRSRELVISFSPPKSGLNARPVHVEYVVEKLALGQVLFWVFQFSAQYHFTHAPHPYSSHPSPTLYELSTGSTMKQNTFIFLSHSCSSYFTPREGTPGIYQRRIVWQQSQSRHDGNHTHLFSLQMAQDNTNKKWLAIKPL